MGGIITALLGRQSQAYVNEWSLSLSSRDSGARGGRDELPRGSEQFQLKSYHQHHSIVRQRARCCVLCPCLHLLLVSPLPGKYNVVPRRREAGDGGSLGRGKPTEAGCLASTRICAVFLWTLQCGGGSEYKNLCEAVGGLCLASWRREGVADGKQN